MSRLDMNANTQSVILPLGGGHSHPGLGSPSGSAPLGIWNQQMASSGSLALPQTSAAAPIGHVAPGHHPYAAAPANAPPPLNHAQGYGQQVAQSQPQQLQPPQVYIYLL